VVIFDNDALTNLDGLANITSIGGGLTIRSNPNVSCEGVGLLLGWPNGPPGDSVNGAIEIRNNAIGCNSIEDVLASISGPSQPTITNALATGGGSIEIEFRASTTTDTLFPINGYEAACTGSSGDLSEAPAVALLDNTPISRTLRVSGDPASVLSSIEVDIDITHSDPADLYMTLTTPGGAELVLWDQGGSGGENIVGTFPTTLTPVDSLNNVTGQTMGGAWVLSVEDISVGPLVREGVLNSWGLRITEELMTAAGSGSPFTFDGLTRGRDYSCTVTPVTKLGVFPASDAVTVSVPLELPTAPTITSTDYEDGTIRLTVSVSDDGGADISEYAATCTDGTDAFTATSLTPTIEVAGLTNGTAYNCTTSATNVVGSSESSVPTASITPEETSTGLPIWLLYKASKPN
jgi:subtilisin-like proprotein convertase family protein